MDQVDFKYIINNKINNKVMQLPSMHSRIFWLSNFKCQTSVSADDFLQALKEAYESSRQGAHFDNMLPHLK